MAVLQQGFVDEPLLSLAQGHDEHRLHPMLSLEQAGEQQRAEEEAGGSDHGTELQSAMDEKVKVLEELVIDADDVRNRTLKEMVQILNPVQAAQYLVAAAQIQVAIRHLGAKHNGTHDDSEHIEA
jgi:hypothetical protein